MSFEWLAVYEGDADGGDGGDTGGDGGGADGDKKLTITQKELNKMMADNRRKLTQQNTELLRQMEDLRGTAKMTDEQRTELEGQIERLQQQVLSKEELARREIDKTKKAYTDSLEKASNEAKRWQSLYTSSTVERTLQDAAIGGEAVQPRQIVAMLGQSTRLAEVLGEDGKPTGAFAPVVKFNDTDKDGNPITLDLSPADAIKRMRELPEYGNLFKGTAKGGLGETGSAGGRGGHPSLDSLLKDPAAYAEWRKKNPDLDISKLVR